MHQWLLYFSLFSWRDITHDIMKLPKSWKEASLNEDQTCWIKSNKQDLWKEFYRTELIKQTFL